VNIESPDMAYLKRTGWIGVLMLLVGCVPTIRTLQPAMTVRVTDGQRKPLQGASVQLGTYQRPFAGRIARHDYVTNAGGRVRTERGTRFELAAFLPDGMNFYSWYLCIEKPGYQPAIVSLPKPRDLIDISLAETSDLMTCQWQEGSEGRLHAPEAVVQL
jgi:hypothetical protein